MDMRKILTITTESPVARYGDWNGFNIQVGKISKRLFETYWIVVDDENLYLYFKSVVLIKHVREFTNAIGVYDTNGGFIKFGVLKIEPNLQTGKKNWI